MAQQNAQNFVYRPELDFNRRADFDFIKRALPGVYLYLFAWPVLFWWTGFHQLQPATSLGFAVAFISICLLRFAHTYYTQQLYDKYPRLWQVALYSLTLGHAITWGSLFYLANLSSAFGSLSTPVNLVIAGISSASLISLIPKYKLAQIYISLLLLPTGLGALLVPDTWQLSLIVIMFWLYLMFIGRRFNKEYVRAFAIEKTLSEKQNELELLSKTDPLTKAYNRLHFDEYLGNLWQNRCSKEERLSLLMLDIDHFKGVNDKYGHVFGDACLKHAANLLHSNLAALQVPLFRYGGEEFSIILSGQNDADLKELTQSILLAFRDAPVVSEGLKHQMTISIGCCSISPKDRAEANELLEQADAALYLAKQNGRDRAELTHYTV